MIDLRSDTVTKPTDAMRTAMARAPVGDDVFGEDPTVQRLEARAAELLGTESALFVPSGTMANQIAILVHTRRGDDVIVGRNAHSYLYESGGGGAIAGVQFTLVGDNGLFLADEAEAAIHSPDHHFSPTSLIIAENTHNRAGGRIFPLRELYAIRALSDARGFSFHIDGARLMNAVVAGGTSAETYGRVAHSLSLCLSKGLGAPVGSVVAGSTDFVVRAHRFRKMLGGGMRQAGIIAAGGLHALEHHVDCLADDHRRARAFAEGISKLEGVSVELDEVETNIVIFSVDDASGLQAVAGELGLLFLAIDPGRIRAVFHLDVTDEDVEAALQIMERALGER